MAMFRPVTVITGASSGIGEALARVFADKGHELVLVARREQVLAPLADEIAAAGHARPTVLAIDLARSDGTARLGHELGGRGLEADFVVNSAGFGLCGLAADLDRAEQLAMIDLNVRTLTDLSLRWTDSLTRHKGGILNVASVAGFLPGPGMAVYYATKAYVLSFTEALHRELASSGVRVTALCPGPVATGFNVRAGGVGGETSPLLVQPAMRVARDGYDGLMAGKRLVVPGLTNKLITLLPRVSSRSGVLTLTSRWLARRRPVRADLRWRRPPSPS